MRVLHVLSERNAISAPYLKDISPIHTSANFKFPAKINPEEISGIFDKLYFFVREIRQSRTRESLKETFQVYSISHQFRVVAAFTENWMGEPVIVSLEASSLCP